MKQLVLSQEKLAKVIESIMGLINSIESKSLRESLVDMLDNSPIGERYFSAPASNRLSYHNCFFGGLAEHSLRVYGNLYKLRNAFAPDISDDSIIFVALMHDLGKVGDINNDFYLPQTSQWHKENQGEYYTHNNDMPYMGAAQRSLRILGQFNVPMTDDEYKAILLHDGQYVPENKNYMHKEGMLGILLHHADVLACKMEKDKWESVQ